MSGALTLAAASRPLVASTATTASLRRHLSALAMTATSNRVAEKPNLTGCRQPLAIPVRQLSMQKFLNKDWSKPHGEISPEDEPYIVRSPYSDVRIPEMNLSEFVFKDTDKWQNKVALVSTFQLVYQFYYNVFTAELT